MMQVLIEANVWFQKISIPPPTEDSLICTLHPQETQKRTADVDSGK